MDAARGHSALYQGRLSTRGHSQGIAGSGVGTEAAWQTLQQVLSCEGMLSVSLRNRRSCSESRARSCLNDPGASLTAKILVGVFRGNLSARARVLFGKIGFWLADGCFFHSSHTPVLIVNVSSLIVTPSMYCVQLCAKAVLQSCNL